MGCNCTLTLRKLRPYLTRTLLRKLPALAILLMVSLLTITNISLNLTGDNVSKESIIRSQPGSLDKAAGIISKLTNITFTEALSFLRGKNGKGERKKTTGGKNGKEERKKATKEGERRLSASKATPRVRSQIEPVNCSYVRHRFFPTCMDKVKRLQRDWNRVKCYRDYHEVNGSQCSIYNYLTNIEPYCLGRKDTYNNMDQPFAKLRYNLTGFLELLPDKIFNWMKKRATFMWPSWVAGAKQFSLLGLKYKTKKVVVYLKGLLKIGFLNCADRGCPLGEIIQWTDLLASLYVLGYNVTVVAKGHRDLSALLKKDENSTSCAVGRYKGMIDVIYIDLEGVDDFVYGIGEGQLAKYRCTLRILDSFGTFAEYNFPQYPHKIPKGRSVWGNYNFILSQFLTLYPHTADNSFLGFVIPNVTKRYSNMNKNDTALLYAKDSSYITYWKSTRRYLDVISEYFEIHATSSSNKHLPSYVYNHGPVSGEKVQELLSKSKLFIGIGFPFEGPGPLEAMANGAVYIQPKYDVPRSKLNDGFWGDKPTLRKLRSQNPYMEEFVGEPYCYTLNVTDEVLLRKTLQKIKDKKNFRAKIPKEFTNEGMLERVHVFTQKMDNCNPYTPRWPPLANMQVYFSKVGQSCKEACMSQGLLCERTYFGEINTVSDIEKYSVMKCNATKHEMFLHAPSMDALTRVCYIQAHEQVFSCMHSEQSMKRLCPCRDYEIEQSAICKNCL